MGFGRVLVGTLFCIVTAMIVIIFVTLGLSVADVEAIGITNPTLYQSIFLVAIHPYSFLIAGSWSLLAALAAGAFIGGLIGKGAKAGLSVGLLSFSLFWILQLAVGVLFDFNTLLVWYGLIEVGGGSVLIDFVLSAGLLAVCGVIGGALTGSES